MKSKAFVLWATISTLGLCVSCVESSDDIRWRGEPPTSDSEADSNQDAEGDADEDDDQGDDKNEYEDPGDSDGEDKDGDEDGDDTYDTDKQMKSMWRCMICEPDSAKRFDWGLPRARKARTRNLVQKWNEAIKK